ncbi:MAG: YidB family protein [Cellvibrionaceae bacterium]
MNNAIFGARLLINNLNLQVSEKIVVDGLLEVFGENGLGIDMVALMAKMADDRELSVILNSWLNYDKSKRILPKELLKIADQKQIENFANVIGVDSASAAFGLSIVLPEMVSNQVGLEIFSAEMDESLMS